MVSIENVYVVYYNCHISLAIDRTKKKKVSEKSREYYNHMQQPIPDTKRKRKQTKPNKRKSNKRTKSTKTSSLFLKRGNGNAKRTEKYKNKITITDRSKTVTLLRCLLCNEIGKFITHTVWLWKLFEL